MAALLINEKRMGFHVFEDELEEHREE